MTGEQISKDVLEHAPESKLTARITGLLFSEDRNKRVVILERSGNQESYGEGERIAGIKAEIVLILQDKLILNENGYYTRMLF
ncbi:MAG: Type II secretion system protein C [Candidatus Erwinia impunctatus]|nr:Type II secretion system protein C [Culicoides impunctatus]